jgi:hypothetical protein
MNTEQYQDVIEVIKRHGELVTKSVNNKITSEEQKEYDEICDKLDRFLGGGQDEIENIKRLIQNE